jgi:protocatechuate 3,4-dioxygenase beta subunit
VACSEIVSDGKVHELRKDLRKLSCGHPAGSLYQFAVAVRAKAGGKAEFELQSLSFESSPAAKNTVAPERTHDEPLQVQVNDLEGQPIAGARVALTSMRQGDALTAMTDAKGQASLAPWRNEKRRYLLRVSASERITVMTAAQPGKPVSVSLEPAYHARGVAVDENGHPVAGAILQFKHDQRQMGPDQWELSQPNVVSDAQGNWEAPGLPRIKGQIIAWHQDYAAPYRSVRFETYATAYDPSDPSIKVRLHHGWFITGQITDAAGQPVPDATVKVGDHFSVIERHADTTTDAKGRFEVKNLVAPQMLITVIKRGHGPAQKLVEAHDWSRPHVVNLTLPAAHTLSFKVVDPRGRPIRDVWIYSGQWGDYSGNLLDVHTDPFGKASFDSAPAEP